MAKVIRYRQDDDQRSSHYDELLAAEARAEKKLVGLHSKKEPPIHRVADVSGVSITVRYIVFRLSSLVILVDCNRPELCLVYEISVNLISSL